MSNKVQNAVAVRDENTAVASMADVMTMEGAWDRVKAIGQALAKSGFLGQGVSENGGIAAALVMAKQGLDPVEFKQRFHIINNQPSRTPNSLLGDFRKIGGSYKIIECTNDACEIGFTYDGNTLNIRLTMEQMSKTSVPWGSNGELKANWKNFPDDMLFARVCGKGLRRVAPELVGGIYTDREVEDFDDEQRTVNAPISVEDVKKRVQAQVAKPEVPNATETEKPVDTAQDTHEDDDVEDVIYEMHEDAASGDCDTCPIAGSFFGVRFRDMSVDILSALLLSTTASAHPELTEKHAANIKAVYEQKMQEVK